MAITPLTIVLGLAGLVFGLVADRIAARWPAHEEDVVRPVDWRTPVVAGLGAIAMGALPSRFSDPATLSIFVAYFLVLILLLATDLDQRLLPDVITLPLIVAAGAVRLLGLLPPEFGPLWSAVLVAIALPAGLYLLSIPFGAGAIGIGDLKLLVSVGLISGLMRSIIGIVSGALLAGAVVLVLLVTRRVTLRTYIPFGPFLIIGAFWAVLNGGVG
ncbi:MAG: prepilin peptidase [Chloroflexi bacterium]|nr:MAG: prepilin peptidase [Chloroflexota bacterium]